MSWDEDHRPRNPSDPRNHPHYRPRGPKRWSFTYADLATAAGVTVAAVKKARQVGRLDPMDVGSVAAWLTAAQARAARRANGRSRRHVNRRLRSPPRA